MSYLLNLGMRRSGLLLLLIIVLPFILLRPISIQVLTVVGFVISWSMGKSNYRLPTIIIFILALGSGGISYLEFSTLRGIAPAVVLLTLLALVQSFELNSVKNFTVFILICKLLLIAQLLDEFSLWYGIYIIGVLIYLFYLLIYFNRQDELRLIKLGPSRKRLIRKIFYYSMPLTLALFILFPRLPIGGFFSFGKVASGATGFTARLRPGDIAKVAQDDRTYFRVKMKKEDLALPLLYWRGGVLSLNNGFNWDKGKVSKRKDFNLKSKELFEYEVRLSNLESSPFFHIKGTKRFFKTSRGYRSSDNAGVSFFHPFENHKTRYRATFSGIKDEWIIEKDRQKYLQVGKEISPSLRNLAQQLKGKNATSTYLNITTYFQKNKFIYTLRPGSQGLDEFIFSNKKGFCEHFASSTTVLLRLAGFPSRIITGFHGGLYNPLGGYYQVRGKDAHAWLEYWSGEKWLRGDPTEVIAPDRINYGLEGLVMRESLPQGINLSDFLGRRSKNVINQMMFAWDSFYNQLNQSFLEYDYKAQRNLFNFKKARYYSGLILFCLCLILILALTFWWSRSLKSKLSTLDKAYLRFLAKVSKAGIETKSTEGALSLERRLPSTWNDVDSCAEILQLYREVKYAEKGHKLDHLLTKIKLFAPVKIPK